MTGSALPAVGPSTSRPDGPRAILAVPGRQQLPLQSAEDICRWEGLDLRGTAVHGPLRHPLGVVVSGRWIVGVDFAAKYGFENAATKQRIFSGRHNFADSLLNESHVFVSQHFLVAEDIGSLNRGDGVIFPHTLQIGMSVGCSRA